MTVRPSSPPGSENPEQHGAVSGAAGEVFLVQHRIEVAEHGRGFGVVDGGGAQRVTGERGYGGGFDALAGHVTEEESPPVVAEWKQVVEVSADLVRRGHAVIRGRPHAGRRRQLDRQQAALQLSDQSTQPVAFVFGRLPGAKEFLLVRAAVARVKERGTDQQRLAVGAGFDRRT